MIDNELLLLGSRCVIERSCQALISAMAVCGIFINGQLLDDLDSTFQ